MLDNNQINKIVADFVSKSLLGPDSVDWTRIETEKTIGVAGELRCPQQFAQATIYLFRYNGDLSLLADRDFDDATIGLPVTVKRCVVSKKKLSMDLAHDDDGVATTALIAELVIWLRNVARTKKAAANRAKNQASEAGKLGAKARWGK